MDEQNNIEYKEKYGFFARVGDSIARPQKIAPYAVRPEGGRAFGYFTLLCLLLAVLLPALLAVKAYPLGGISRSIAIIPDFQLENGKLHVDISEPFVYDNNNTVIIIENGSGSGIEKQYEDKYLSQFLYVNSDGFSYFGKGQSRDMLWSEVNKTFTRRTLEIFCIRWAWAGIIGLGLVMFGGYFVGGLFFGLILTLIGLIINAVVGSKLSFEKIFALSLYAMTLNRLLEALLSGLSFGGLSIGFSIPWYGSYVITLAYMALYMNAVKPKAPVDIEMIEN